MDVKKVVNYFENSFLKELLDDPEITDISYNGAGIYYLHNLLGRKEAFKNIGQDEVKDFVRQIANMSEKQFSFSNPVLDVSFGKYRFNAVHQSIGKLNNLDVITFAIRIGSSALHIRRKGDFLSEPVAELIDVLIRSKTSIVIGGQTGSGKTELQKYVITRMEDNTRIIVIDNVLELDMIELVDNLDMNIWQADGKTPCSTIEVLVKNALRSNPDWLIVAEARGAEMIDVLNSAMTGHPIITTIHSLDAKSMPTRMARMVMMNEKKMSYDDVYSDIIYHFHFFIYMKRTIRKDGKVVRYISEIVEYENEKKYRLIYKNDLKKETFHPISREILEQLSINEEEIEFKKKFMEGE